MPSDPTPIINFELVLRVIRLTGQNKSSLFLNIIKERETLLISIKPTYFTITNKEADLQFEIELCVTVSVN